MSDKFWSHYPAILLKWYKDLCDGKDVPNLFLYGPQNSGKTLFCEMVEKQNKDFTVVEDILKDAGFDENKKYVATATSHKNFSKFLHVELEQIKNLIPYNELVG